MARVQLQVGDDTKADWESHVEESNHSTLSGMIRAAVAAYISDDGTSSNELDEVIELLDSVDTQVAQILASQQEIKGDLIDSDLLFDELEDLKEDTNVIRTKQLPPMYAEIVRGDSE